MSNSNKPTCETCKFYKPRETKQPTGSCRRYPPTRIAEVYSSNHNEGDVCTDVSSDFPVVVPDEWCGEYIPVEQGEASLEGDPYQYHCPDCKWNQMARSSSEAVQLLKKNRPEVKCSHSNMQLR